eukprot:scpid108125/ scgid26904/ 
MQTAGFRSKQTTQCSLTSAHVLQSCVQELQRCNRFSRKYSDDPSVFLSLDVISWAVTCVITLCLRVMEVCPYPYGPLSWLNSLAIIMSSKDEKKYESANEAEAVTETAAATVEAAAIVEAAAATTA